MSEVRRRKFDKEFKLEAVSLVVEEGRSVAEVARNLGIYSLRIGFRFSNQLFENFQLTKMINHPCIFYSF